MRRDPTAFRERFKKWKETGEYELPRFEDGYESFLKTLPKNQRTPGAYNTRRYWELNGKPKDFAEAIGKGMYTIQNDNGVLGWHANSVAYNESNDTYEFMKPNYHPTRWMEQVYGYDQSPEFQKDYKVQYNGPMLSDRYVRREKPGLKVKGGQLPKFADGYERQNGNPVKFDEEGNLVDQVTGETGTMLLPDLNVTAAHPKNYRSSYDPNAIRTFTDWLPIVGDIGTGIDIKNAINNKNYLEAGVLGGLMVLPEPIAKGTKKLFKPVSKKVNRLFSKIDWQDPLQVKVPEAENQTWAEITAAKYANKVASKNPIPASDKDKEIFKNAWEIATRNRPIRSVDELTHGFNFTTPKDKYRFVNLINRNPEYYEFLRREGITDPLSQENVSKFLDNQFTSVRGVVANDVEEAIPMLTNTEYGRKMSGGDRLDTYGGLYTSNSTTIADRFKNPQGNKIGNGYVATVKYPHNISTNIPIEDQLEQYRKKILIADNRNPLFGTKYYDIQRQNKDVVGLEADYVGRASMGDKSIQERAYLPNYNVFGTQSNPEKTVDIIKLQEFKNQTDQHGRWLAQPEEGSKAGLFIPKTLNNYSDFVRAAKIVLKPQPNRELYKEVEDKALETFRNQWGSRNKMLSKIYDTQRKVKNRVLAGTLLSSITIPFGIGVYKTRKDNEFYDSPEYEEFIKDPNFDKYINLDDGDFMHLSSFNKLERKYRNKYKKRIQHK